MNINNRKMLCHIMYIINAEALSMKVDFHLFLCRILGNVIFILKCHGIKGYAAFSFTLHLTKMLERF